MWRWQNVGGQWKYSRQLCQAPYFQVRTSFILALILFKRSTCLVDRFLMLHKDLSFTMARQCMSSDELPFSESGMSRNPSCPSSLQTTRSTYALPSSMLQTHWLWPISWVRSFFQQSSLVYLVRVLLFFVYFLRCLSVDGQTSLSSHFEGRSAMQVEYISLEKVRCRLVSLFTSRLTCTFGLAIMTALSGLGFQPILPLRTNTSFLTSRFKIYSATKRRGKVQSQNACSTYTISKIKPSRPIYQVVSVVDSGALHSPQHNGHDNNLTCTMLYFKQREMQLQQLNKSAINALAGYGRGTSALVWDRCGCWRRRGCWDHLGIHELGIRISRKPIGWALRVHRGPTG